MLGQDNKVNGFENDITDSAASTDIVLHEDKTYFASANDIYGDGVETITRKKILKILRNRWLNRSKHARYQCSSHECQKQFTITNIWRDL